MARRRARLCRADGDAVDSAASRRRRGSPTSGTRKVGGMLADAIGTQRGGQGLRRRGARGCAARARCSPNGSRRTRRTWMRGTWQRHRRSSLCCWAIRAAVIGTGAVALVAAARRRPATSPTCSPPIFVLHGYLRDVGQHVHNLQRSVNEMEELVELHDEPLGVADRAGRAADPRSARGEIRVRGRRPSTTAATRRRSTRRST